MGQLVPIRGYDTRHGRHYEHVAFIPDPLPESVALSEPTWAEVARAMRALGRLDQAGRQLPNARLFRRPAIRREAVSTSALEGTFAAFTDVLEAETEVEDPADRSLELTEVLNYVRAAEYAFEIIGERPLSVGLLCELQALLVANTPAGERDPGRVRTHQVVIGPEGVRIEEARFVPPPADPQLETGLREWEAWVATRRDLPSVVQVALAHYQLEALHPFHDGNGRIGRLALVLHLMRLGELREPLLTVSTWLESRRREYQDRLLDVSRSGDLDGWVGFLARAVREQAEETVDKVERLLALQEGIRRRIREAPIRGVAAQIAEDLVGQPMISPTYAARAYGVSYPAANSAVQRLARLGLLEEVTGRRYKRLFASRDVLEIVQS